MYPERVLFKFLFIYFEWIFHDARPGIQVRINGVRLRSKIKLLKKSFTGEYSVLKIGKIVENYSKKRRLISFEMKKWCSAGLLLQFRRSIENGLNCPEEPFLVVR